MLRWLRAWRTPRRATSAPVPGSAKSPYPDRPIEPRAARIPATSALPLDQQREDLDLAVGFSAVLIRRLFISEIADRPCADLPPHAGFLEGLARSRFRRRQPLDRPTLGNNPPPRLSSCNDEDFKRGHLREPIRQRAILDADCRPCPSFLRLARDNGISGANMRQRIASAYLRIGEIKEKALARVLDSTAGQARLGWGARTKRAQN